MAQKVSPAVIRRLPKYYRYLKELQRNGVIRISSTSLGNGMGLTASQVRQDFNCFGGFGQQGYGYNVEALQNELAAILKLNAGYRIIIIGAGNLAHALINNFIFSANGFTLVCAFDVAPDKVGTQIHDIPIYHMDELEQMCQVYQPDAAVLTCPGKIAGAVAQRLTALGIRGFWNFTNTDLPALDADVVCENVHLSDSLMTLCCCMEKGG